MCWIDLVSFMDKKDRPVDVGDDEILEPEELVPGAGGEDAPSALDSSALDSSARAAGGADAEWSGAMGSNPVGLLEGFAQKWEGVGGEQGGEEAQRASDFRQHAREQVAQLNPVSN